MISGGRTFSEQAEAPRFVPAYHPTVDQAATVQARVEAARGERASWYVSGPDEDGLYSLRVDDGLKGTELGASDATGLFRLQELVRLHNGQQAS